MPMRLNPAGADLAPVSAVVEAQLLMVTAGARHGGEHLRVDGGALSRSGDGGLPQRPQSMA